METTSSSLTLSYLIRNALDSHRHYELEWNQHCPNDKLLTICHENAQLAENALLERLAELIDARIERARK